MAIYMMREKQEVVLNIWNIAVTSASPFYSQISNVDWLSNIKITWNIITEAYTQKQSISVQFTNSIWTIEWRTYWTNATGALLYNNSWVWWWTIPVWWSWSKPFEVNINTNGYTQKITTWWTDYNDSATYNFSSFFGADNSSLSITVAMAAYWNRYTEINNLVITLE